MQTGPPVEPMLNHNLTGSHSCHKHHRAILLSVPDARVLEEVPGAAEVGAPLQDDIAGPLAVLLDEQESNLLCDVLQLSIPDLLCQRLPTTYTYLGCVTTKREQSVAEHHRAISKVCSLEVVGGVEPAYAGPDDDAVRVLLLAHDGTLENF